MNLPARRTSALIVICGATALSAGAQDADESNEERTVETVLVTGQKVNRDLQDTVDSVKVVTELDFVEKNIVDLIDVFDRTANVTSVNGASFNIRGINSLNVSGGGSSDLATIYVDGSPLPRQASFAAPVDIWDVEQIEIFRGPQSTLQGRASLAGAILVNTADPTFEWTGR
ncbi:MAG: Plug domain-containing protein, partial [Pseudomonadota bacterium]